MEVTLEVYHTGDHYMLDVFSEQQIDKGDSIVCIKITDEQAIELKKRGVPEY